MRATKFEFENRFWLIGVIFGLGYGLPPIFDHVNAAESLVRALRPGLSPESAEYRYQIQGVFLAGTLLVFIAAWLRTWATAYLNASIVHDAPLHSEQPLVASGPYRYTRNPLYFATILMTVGYAFVASRSGAILLILAQTIFQYRLILREESELLATQGESYRRNGRRLSARRCSFGSLESPNWFSR
jgi:protein-S-isoprenylcysteine O-methyltransferase Ste14